MNLLYTNFVLNSFDNRNIPEQTKYRSQIGCFFLLSLKPYHFEERS